MLLKSLNNKLIVSLGNAALPFAENKTVRAINDGLINLVPIVFICSLFTVFFSLPVPAYQEALNNLTGGNWAMLGHMATQAIGDIVALAAMVSVSLSLAEESSSALDRETNVFVPLFTTLVCYVIFFVFNQAYNPQVAELSAPSALASGGSRAIISGLVVAIVATKLFIAFNKLWQKLWAPHRRTVDSNYQLRIAIRALFPLLMTVAVFLLARIVINWVQANTELEASFYALMAQAVNEGSFASVLVSQLLMQLLWFFGANGTETLQAFLPQGAAGALALGSPDAAQLASAATSLPATAAALPATAASLHSTVASVDFYQHFVELGGPGATLGILIALLVFGSAARGKRIARFAAVPSLFNANEVVVYGLPVVLNPYLLVPFILAPVAVAAVSYGAFALGVVPLISSQVSGSMPLVVSGYLATGSVAGSVLQVLCLGISVAMYAPFVLITRSATERYQQAIYGRFKTIASLAANNEQTLLMTRRDDIGTLTRDFIAEIHEYFVSGKLPFFMVFQPKTNQKGEVAGAEALLRWTHPRFGPIPPDIVIELTDEAGVSTEFGRWITTASLEEFARWKALDIKQVSLSINLNPRHLALDAEFPSFLESELARLNIDSALIELEITEHVAVGPSADMQQMFSRLRALGVGLSIDDMGMGYSSLTYISDFGVGTVKVDISLIDKVDTDYQQQEIVRSVVELATSLDLAVIVEGVETQEQLDTLVALGCCFFQGYYFSKPLPPAEFVTYVSTHGQTRLLHN